MDIKKFLHEITRIDENGDQSFYKVINELANKNNPASYSLGQASRPKPLRNNKYIKFASDRRTVEYTLIKIIPRYDKNIVQMKLSLRDDINAIYASSNYVIDLHFVLMLGYDISNYKHHETIYWWMYGLHQNIKVNIHLETVTLNQIPFYFRKGIDHASLGNTNAFSKLRNHLPIVCKYDNWEKIYYMKKKMHKSDLSLFVGAGISSGSSLPSWADLLSFIRKWFIEQNMQTSDDESYDPSLIERNLLNTNNSFPLIEAEIYEKGIGSDNLISFLQTKLYENQPASNLTIEAINSFCHSIGNGISINNIITYNYDDLIEFCFSKRNPELSRMSIHTHIDSKSIPVIKDSAINIYHVHGYIPRDDSFIEQNLVFSDSSYNRLYNDIYSWSNMIQLKFLLSSTCLFIGQSGNDPNLRRLLSSIKQVTHNRHFIIQERFKSDVDSNLSNIEFDRKYNDIVGTQFSDLGLEVIWVDSYDEIQQVLNKIKL